METATDAGSNRPAPPKKTKDKKINPQIEQDFSYKTLFYLLVSIIDWGEQGNIPRY